MPCRRATASGPASRPCRRRTARSPARGAIGAWPRAAPGMLVGGRLGRLVGANASFVTGAVRLRTAFPRGVRRLDATPPPPAPGPGRARCEAVSALPAAAPGPQHVTVHRALGPSETAGRTRLAPCDAGPAAGPPCGEDKRREKTSEEDRAQRCAGRHRRGHGRCPAAAPVSAGGPGPRPRRRRMLYRVRTRRPGWRAKGPQQCT